MNIKKIKGIVGFSGLKRKRYYFLDSKVTLSGKITFQPALQVFFHKSAYEVYSDTKRFDITVR